jgi:hypothetical protein
MRAEIRKATVAKEVETQERCFITAMCLLNN